MIPKDKDDRPKILGRFNFVQYKKDYFNLLFIPFFGSSAIVIARNLYREDMERLMYDLNRGLDRTSRVLREFEEDPEDDEDLDTSIIQSPYE